MTVSGLHFDVFTLFPGMFSGPLDESIIHRAQQRGLIEIAIHDIRDWTHDRHRTVDDNPFGGGAGMVMKAPPIVEAVEAVLGNDLRSTEIVLMSASGARFNQNMARTLAAKPRVALICGHYEGVDHRVVQILGCREVSIGDFVLTGGELPAMTMIDAIARLAPGVIQEASLNEESHDEGQVEYPHYTRPAEYRGLTVPEVLLSGHHAQIDAWRREQARIRTTMREESES
jgi:tRNA (guanine37-N1)-methyltransferase